MCLGMIFLELRLFLKIMGVSYFRVFVVNIELWWDLGVPVALFVKKSGGLAFFKVLMEKGIVIIRVVLLQWYLPPHMLLPCLAKTEDFLRDLFLGDAVLKTSGRLVVSITKGQCIPSLSMIWPEYAGDEIWIMFPGQLNIFRRTILVYLNYYYICLDTLWNLAQLLVQDFNICSTRLHFLSLL